MLSEGNLNCILISWISAGKVVACQFDAALVHLMQDANCLHCKKECMHPLEFGMASICIA